MSTKAESDELRIEAFGSIVLLVVGIVVYAGLGFEAVAFFFLYIIALNTTYGGNQ